MFHPTHTAPLLRRACICIAASIASIAGCTIGTGPDGDSFEGILMTDETGRHLGSIGDASDDWQPLTDAGAEFDPAAPNPASTTCTLSAALATNSTVRIWVESSPGKLYSTVFQGEMQAGRYTVDVDWKDAPNGIYRCYLSVMHNGKQVVTYGDVKIAK